jgi:hypothetical protein
MLLVSFGFLKNKQTNTNFHKHQPSRFHKITKMSFNVMDMTKGSTKRNCDIMLKKSEGKLFPKSDIYKIRTLIFVTFFYHVSRRRHLFFLQRCKPTPSRFPPNSAHAKT